MSDTRNRQPKGIPAGGEFAKNAHGDAGSDLVDPTETSQEWQQKRDRYWDAQRAHRDVVRNEIADLIPEEYDSAVLNLYRDFGAAPRGDFLVFTDGEESYAGDHPEVEQEIAEAIESAEYADEDEMGNDYLRRPLEEGAGVLYDEFVVPRSDRPRRTELSDTFSTSCSAYYDAQRQFRQESIREIISELPDDVHGVTLHVDNESDPTSLRPLGFIDENGDTVDSDDDAAMTKIEEISDAMEYRTFDEADSDLFRLSPYGDPYGDTSVFVIRRSPA